MRTGRCALRRQKHRHDLSAKAGGSWCKQIAISQAMVHSANASRGNEFEARTLHLLRTPTECKKYGRAFWKIGDFVDCQ